MLSATLIVSVNSDFKLGRSVEMVVKVVVGEISRSL